MSLHCPAHLFVQFPCAPISFPSRHQLRVCVCVCVCALLSCHLLSPSCEGVAIGLRHLAEWTPQSASHNQTTHAPHAQTADTRSHSVCSARLISSRLTLTVTCPGAPALCGGPTRLVAGGSGRGVLGDDGDAASALQQLHAHGQTAAAGANHHHRGDTGRGTRRGRHGERDDGWRQGRQSMAGAAWVSEVGVGESVSRNAAWVATVPPVR